MNFAFFDELNIIIALFIFFKRENTQPTYFRKMLVEFATYISNVSCLRLRIASRKQIKTTQPQVKAVRLRIRTTMAPKTKSKSFGLYVDTPIIIFRINLTHG